LSVLSCLEPATSSLDALVASVREQDCPVLIGGASAVVLAAAIAQRTRIAGVWLTPSADYPTALVARDVATLAWLSEIEHVVIEASEARAHVEAISAMLSNDEITFANEVAHVSHAYNRPAPPRALHLWWVEGEDLVDANDRLEGAYRRDDVGRYRDFSPPRR
jgi:hypothetical protein